MKGFDKYLREANHNLQIANNMDELKSYVACILYDNDKKDKEIESLNKELEEYKKDFKEANDLALKLITNNQEYVCKSIKDTIDILIEKLQQKESIIKEVRELCEKQFIIYEVNSLGGKIKRYAPISTDKIMEILGDNDE